MKLGEVARFTPERRNGPVEATPRVVARQLAKIVEQNPGLSASGIASKITPQPSRDFKNTVSTRLYQMAQAKKPKVKSVRLDGRIRYYPPNYKLSTDPKPEAPVTTPKPQVDMQVSRAEFRKVVNGSVEQLAMQYVWESDTLQLERDALKKFVQWCKANQETK